MNVNHGIRVGYNNIFDDKPLAFGEYFKGMGKKNIFSAISFLVNVAQPKSFIKDSRELIQIWFCPKNSEIRDHVLDRLSSEDKIENIISSLHLVEFVLQNEFDEIQTVSETEFEINLLKAYLVLNSRQDLIEDEGQKQLNLSPIESDKSFEALYLISNFHDYDLTNYEIEFVFISQLIKSIEFFKYLENRQELSPHLEKFLQIYECNTWQEWLRQSLSIITPLISEEKKAFFDFVVKNDFNYTRSCIFLDSFHLKEDTAYFQSDFIALRSSPLHKINEGHYRVLSDIFLIEKIFKSIQFTFSLKINNELPKEQRIKDFRADHCDKFSEQTIFYNAVKWSFPNNSNWIQLSGENFKSQNYSSEPDYYVRFKNKIFLFESKDVFLKGDEKQSNNYQILKKALGEKFYFLVDKSEKKEFKAILQLIENIKRILSKFYQKCDADYESKNIKIYPILVTHDRQFDSFGVNALLNKWFLKELSIIRKEYDISRVQPLVLINIDTFLLHHYILKQRDRLKFEDLIDKYFKMVNFDSNNCKNLAELEQKYRNSIMSFSLFAQNEIDKHRLNRYPSMLTEYLKLLNSN